MGCATTIACKTCKKLYYCGYGRYSESRKRADKFDRSAHAGHEVEGPWIDDYEYGIEDGNLYAMGSWGSRGEVILENIAEYETVDL